MTGLEGYESGVTRAPSVAFRRLLQPHVEECLFVPLGDAEHPAGLGYGIRRISFRHLIEIPMRQGM